MKTVSFCFYAFLFLYIFSYLSCEKNTDSRDNRNLCKNDEFVVGKVSMIGVLRARCGMMS